MRSGRRGSPFLCVLGRCLRVLRVHLSSSSGSGERAGTRKARMSTHPSGPTAALNALVTSFSQPRDPAGLLWTFTARSNHQKAELSSALANAEGAVVAQRSPRIAVPLRPRALPPLPPRSSFFFFWQLPERAGSRKVRMSTHPRASGATQRAPPSPARGEGEFARVAWIKGNCRGRCRVGRGWWRGASPWRAIGAAPPGC